MLAIDLDHIDSYRFSAKDLHDAGFIRSSHGTIWIRVSRHDSRDRLQIWSIHLAPHGYLQEDGTLGRSTGETLQVFSTAQEAVNAANEWLKANEGDCDE